MIEKLHIVIDNSPNPFYFVYNNDIMSTTFFLLKIVSPLLWVQMKILLFGKKTYLTQNWQWVDSVMTVIFHSTWLDITWWLAKGKGKKKSLGISSTFLSSLSGVIVSSHQRLLYSIFYYTQYSIIPWMSANHDPGKRKTFLQKAETVNYFKKMSSDWEINYFFSTQEFYYRQCHFSVCELLSGGPEWRWLTVNTSGQF